MTLEELMAQIEEAGLDGEARFVIDDGYGDWVLVNLVDVEEGPVSFIRFFRSDDIPTSLGSPGNRIPAETIEDCASVTQMEDHATMRVRYPWNYPCRMSVPGHQFWHDVEIREFAEEYGYDIVVLEDAGEAHDFLF